MKKMTNFGLVAVLLATLATLSACSSKPKAEDKAENALVQQTQDLQVEEAFQPDDTADLGANSSGLGH